MVGLVGLVVAAAVTQHWTLYLYSPKAMIWISLAGVTFDFPTTSAWAAGYVHPPDWSVDYLLLPPNLRARGGVMTVLIPWWLPLLTWSLLTAFIWRLTRRRKVPHGFPIEPTAMPQ